MIWLKVLYVFSSLVVLLSLCQVEGKARHSVALHGANKLTPEQEQPKSSLWEYLSKYWRKAAKLAKFESEVERVNVRFKNAKWMVRRLIVMPITDNFQTNKADPMYGKLQFGDKCSLPNSLGQQIIRERYEVPWIFEITPLRNVPRKHIPPVVDTSKSPISKNGTSNGEVLIFDKNLRSWKPRLETAYISPLDFRAPENYIFLPQWLMHDMQLEAFDLVEISMLKIRLASLVKLQPLSLEWDDLIKESSVDPQVLLEQELNKYASLTFGSTITLSINQREYKFFVNETIAENGVPVMGVRIQDSDVRTDIDRSILDRFLMQRKKQLSERRAKQGDTSTNSSIGTKSTSTKKQSISEAKKNSTAKVANKKRSSTNKRDSNDL